MGVKKREKTWIRLSEEQMIWLDILSSLRNTPKNSIVSTAVEEYIEKYKTPDFQRMVDELKSKLSSEDCESEDQIDEVEEDGYDNDTVEE